MGELAMKYGYYSADWSSEHGVEYAMGEGGEALTVIDPLEAWMFHIIPDPTGTSAIWVAQLIPEGHISVVANQFVIREVLEQEPNSGGNLNPHATFLYSNNLYTVAENLGWYKRSDNVPLNFLKVICGMYVVVYVIIM
jgi:dipeptidase